MRRKAVLWIGSFIVLLFLSCFTVFSTSVAPYFETDSMNEYEAFIRTEDLVEEFLFYEDVSYFGEFHLFCAWDESEKSYFYDFITPAGIKVRLLARKREQTPFGEILINESKDLRQYWNTVSGNVIINDIAYNYVNGQLNCIRWWDQGYYFVLSYDDVLTKSYPYVEGDFICQLLMRDTAEDAIEVLLGRKEYTPPQPSTDTVTDPATDTATTDAIPSGGENASFPWLWIALPVGTVVIAGGATFVLFRKKRRTEN